MVTVVLAVFIFSVAAGAGEVVNREPTGFGWIKNMQDMNSSVCDTMMEGVTGTLRDVRDDKVYWVAKLKDGNCWMTQNLDLDLSNITLTPIDSDITTNWTSTAGDSGLWTGDSPSSNMVKYYDPGNYVYTTPDTQNNCGNSTSGLAGCTGNGWKNISGMSASDDPNFAGVVKDNTYDAHYLAGNYYSWGAATAGQAASLTSDTPGEQSTQSICPKGWTLPTDGTDEGQYTALVSNLTIAQLTTSPYYFIYGGFVAGDTLYNAGSEGNYWSSTAYGNDVAYFLDFDTSITSSSSWHRYNGFPVRCVAR